MYESLRAFAYAYATLRQAGDERRFIFTTTAESGDLDLDIAAAWNDPDQRAPTSVFIRRLEQGREVLGRPLPVSHPGSAGGEEEFGDEAVDVYARMQAALAEPVLVR